MRALLREEHATLCAEQAKLRDELRWLDEEHVRCRAEDEARAAWRTLTLTLTITLNLTLTLTLSLTLTLTLTLTRRARRAHSMRCARRSTPRWALSACG